MCPCVCVCVAWVNSSTSYAASMACATSNSCHDIGQLLAAALIAVEKPKASPDSCCLGPVPASISKWFMSADFLRELTCEASSYHIPSFAGWLDPDPNAMPHSRDHWDNYQQLHWHKYLSRHQKMDTFTQNYKRNPIRNVPKSTSSWVDHDGSLSMKSDQQRTPRRSHAMVFNLPPYMPLHQLHHTLRLLGPAYWSPSPKTTPSIHRWVYETWLSVAIPKLHSMQHLLPEPTKQLCMQNIQNDIF